MTARAIWALVAAALLLLPVAAGAQGNPDALLHLCTSLKAAHDRPQDARYESRAEEILYQASGADIARDSNEVATAKVKAMIAQRLAMPRERSGLFCDHERSFLPTTALLFAAEWWAVEDVRRMVSLGFDINFIDPKNGKTLLDSWRDRTDVYLSAGERTFAPVGRGDSKHLAIQNVENYWSYRRMGARHKSELGYGPLGPCAPTAADASAPGVPFDGQLSTTGGGATPQSIPGATTVSVRQAGCLMSYLADELLILEAMNEPWGIPGSLAVGWAAAGPPFEGEVQSELEKLLAVYTRDGGKQRPILVYCHHVNCRLSYNAVLRLQRAGYKNIFWLRDGAKAWEEGGLPLARPIGYIDKGVK